MTSRYEPMFVFSSNILVYFPVFVNLFLKKQMLQDSCEYPITSGIHKNPATLPFV